MMDDETDEVFPLDEHHRHNNDKLSPNNRKIAKLNTDYANNIHSSNIGASLSILSPIQLGTTPIHISSIPDIDTTIDDDTDDNKQDSTRSQPITINDFVLLKVIGRGAYGKVFQAYKKHNGTVYAIKVLKKYELIDRNVFNNILSEKNVLMSISHPFIVKLDSAFQSHTKLYLVLEYCGGGELFTYLDEKKELNESETCFYAAQVLSALSYLHSLNILYRDLKPENILINFDGFIQLTDFGFAKKYVEDAHSTSFVGTVQYMAPEIVQKIGHSRTADYWALGILIYEMLTGKTPFDNSNRKKVQYNIIHAPLRLPRYLSKHAVSLLDGLLTKDPVERLGYNGVEEIKQHRFFENVDWTALEEKRVKPPFIPKPPKTNKLTGERADTSRFDKQFTDEKVVDSPLDGNFVDKADTFAGFSYTRDFTPHDYQYRQLHTPINNDSEESTQMFTFAQTSKSHQPHDIGQPAHGSLARFAYTANGEATNGTEHHASTASTLTDVSSDHQRSESPTVAHAALSTGLTPSVSSASISSMVAGTDSLSLDNRSNQEGTGTSASSVNTTPHGLKKSASSSLSLQLAAIRSSPTQRDGSTPTQSPYTNDRLHTSQSSNDISTQRKLISQLAPLPIDSNKSTAQPNMTPQMTSTSAWARPITSTLAATSTPKQLSAAKPITITNSPSTRTAAIANKPFNHHRQSSKVADNDGDADAMNQDDDDQEWQTVPNKNGRNWKWK